MKRKALIIGNSGNKNNPDEHLKGVQQDVKNYKEFLLSEIGGKWYENEIIVSLDETKAQIEQKISTLKHSKYDFIFILFSGHGSYSTLKECRKLYINNDSIYEDKLLYLAPKQITIIDTCADIEYELLSLSLEESQIANHILKAMSIDYRKKYEDAINLCPQQQVVLYSSSIGESSGESTQLGGYFAHSLLKVALFNKEEVLNSREAYSRAEEIVKRKTRNTQNPEGKFIKSSNILPFSLGK